MPAPLKLTADDLQAISAFLNALTEATRQTGVQLGVHMRPELSVDGATTIAFRWDDEHEQYLIDDQVGD